MGGSFPFKQQAPQNDFWQIVFEYWKDFSQKNRPKCNEDISQSSICHNYQLSKYPPFPSLLVQQRNTAGGSYSSRGWVHNFPYRIK